MGNVDYAYLLRNFIDEKGRVTAWPAKRKMKVFALYYLADKIDGDIVCTESDFNDLLEKWHTFHDPATLRRELFSYGFIKRDNNGSNYSKSSKTPVIEL